MSDDMVEDLSISGTREECRDKTSKLYNYGITLPMIRGEKHLKNRNQEFCLLYDLIRRLFQFARILISMTLIINIVVTDNSDNLCTM